MTAKIDQSPPWTTDDGRDLYRVDTWGRGFVDVNAAGHVTVGPTVDADGRADDRPAGPGLVCGE